MKMIRYCLNEMKQVILSVPFWVCCLLVMALETTAGFCIIGETEISVIEAIFYFSQQERESNVLLNSFAAFSAGTGSWLSLFAPVITALPFVVLFRDETSTGYRRFRIVSIEDKKLFCMIKYIVCFFTGALIMFTGTLMFAVITEIFFPSLRSFGSEYSEMVLSSYSVSGVLQANLQHLVCCFFYGGFWALMSFGLLGKIANKYLIVGIPFMVKYMWRELYFKAGDKGVGPDNLLQIFYGSQSGLWIIFLYVFLGFMSFIMFYICTVRKEDVGV